MFWYNQEATAFAAASGRSSTESLFDGVPVLMVSTRSSSREVRIRVPCFSVVYFSRGTLKKGKRALLGDLVNQVDVAFLCEQQPAQGGFLGELAHAFLAVSPEKPSRNPRKTAGVRKKRNKTEG